MTTVESVYISMLKTLKFSGENPFVLPAQVLKDPYSPLYSLSIAICFVLGITIAAVVLLPNRYTIGLIVTAIVLWYFVGNFISWAYASC